MDTGAWEMVLVVALAVNAAIGFGYRVFRLTKGGPIADVWGQAILGVGLVGIALTIGLGGTWARWIAFAYAALFALVVMPIWVLGVLIPLRPRAVDYAFTACYWIGLIAIGVAALAI